MNLIVLNSFTDWLNNAWAWIKDFFNQPVPIIGCTVLFLSIFILKVLANTSWGKKALKKVQEKISLVESSVESQLKEIRDEKAKIEQEYIELKKEYDAELKKQEVHIEKLETLISDIADNIHNKKIKELIESYKGEKDNGEENNCGQTEE